MRCNIGKHRDGVSTVALFHKALGLFLLFLRKMLLIVYREKVRLKMRASFLASRRVPMFVFFWTSRTIASIWGCVLFEWDGMIVVPFFLFSWDQLRFLVLLQSSQIAVSVGITMSWWVTSSFLCLGCVSNTSIRRGVRLFHYLFHFT